MQIGVRSCLEDEEIFAREEDIKYYTSTEVKSNITEIEKVISNIKTPIYVTIDIDVLDPAYAPSVGTPASFGLEPHELQKLINNLQGKEIIGLDVVEVSSSSIGDRTSINGAQVIYDFLSLQ
jgi:agmatinase